MELSSENSRFCSFINFHRLKCFSYGTRRLQSKGVILVLIWNFAGFVLVGLRMASPRDISNSFGLIFVLLSGLSVPIIGCLSDIYIGRYKVIRYCMWIIFVSLIISNMLLVIKLYMWDVRILQIFEYISSITASIGLAGVLANTMQLGIDQLIDSASTNITSYISWYIWTISFACSSIAVSQKCFCGVYNSSTSFFLLPLLFAIAIVSDF